MVLKNMLDLALFDNEDSSIKNNLKKTKFNSIKNKIIWRLAKTSLNLQFVVFIVLGKETGSSKTTRVKLQVIQYVLYIKNLSKYGRFEWNRL